MTPNYARIVGEDVNYILKSPLQWSDFYNSTIIISGIAGFLAAYIAETLAELNRCGANIRIVGLVRNMDRALSRLGHLLPDGLELIKQDITSPLSAEIPRGDYIIHAASQASPKFFGVDPVGTIQANTIGTIELLKMAQSAECKSFLFFSSGEVYGLPANEEKLISEETFGYLDPATVRACYAESKRVGETMCVAWYNQHSVKTKIIRPFHTYGPGMMLDDGRVFADFVSDVVADRDIVLKSDGSAMRPLCYIADAILGAFTVLLRGQPAEAYNIANPEAELTMLELAQTVAKIFPDKETKIKFDIKASSNKYLKSPIQRSCPSIAKMNKLGWMPKTGVSAGFEKTIKSYLS